ncbi:MAG: PRC-barrel domain-containing protein [Actinomycetota bacterium]
MEEADHRRNNPYTELEGYTLIDASGAEIGEVERTVYDAVSDVLKYVVVNGRTVPAQRIEVDPENERVTVPYAAETVQSAPEIEEPSGGFDKAVLSHYGERA